MKALASCAPSEACSSASRYVFHADSPTIVYTHWVSLYAPIFSAYKDTNQIFVVVLVEDGALSLVQVRRSLYH